MINLAKFKKVDDDGKMATLQHDDGHTLKVLIKKLSPIQREQMKRLKLAKGGKIQKYDDGGSVSDESSDSNSDNSAQATPATNITINAAPANSSAASPTPVSAITPGPSTGNMPPQAPAGTTSSLVDPALTQTPPINQPNIAPAQNVNTPNANPLPALNQLNQSAQDEAKIQAAKAKALQPAYDAQAVAQAKLLQSIQDSHNRIKQATDTYANYINQNPIDAQRFAKNMTGGQKLASAVGLFLGGFSAPLGGHNYALDEINNAISRDIDAQKTNATNQHNVWSSYNDLFHDDQLATQLSQVTLNNIMSKHIDAVANQLGTATAAMQAKRYGAEAALKNNDLSVQAAGRLGLQGMTQNGQPQSAPINVPPQAQNNGSQPQQPGPYRSGYALPEDNSPENSGASVLQNIKPKEVSYEDNHILSPDAQDKLGQLRNSAHYGKTAVPIDAIQNQYTQADQAEKTLGTVDPVFQKMSDAADQGGETGFLRRNIEAVGHVPVVGPAIEGANDWVTNFGPNRTYDTVKTQLINDVANSLKGTSVGVDEIRDMINKNAPEYGDTSDQRKEKNQNIKGFIKRAVQTSLLKEYNLAPQDKKK